MQPCGDALLHHIIVCIENIDDGAKVYLQTAIRLINHPNFTNSLQSLSYLLLVADLSIFYRYFHGHCSLEIRNISPGPVRHVQTTRISTHSHPFQVTLSNSRTLAHKSSFIPRTSQLWNTLPSTAFPKS